MTSQEHRAGIYGVAEVLRRPGRGPGWLHGWRPGRRLGWRLGHVSRRVELCMSGFAVTLVGVVLSGGIAAADSVVPTFTTSSSAPGTSGISTLMGDVMAYGYYGSAAVVTAAGALFWASGHGGRTSQAINAHSWIARALGGTALLGLGSTLVSTVHAAFS